MELAQIHRCLGDETRLRILHLLTRGPLCVCHFQDVLRLPQVAVSKHLGYLRAKGLVTATRKGQWMIYQIPADAPVELGLQLKCLRECVRAHPLFEADMKRRESLCCDEQRSGVAALRSLRSIKPRKP
ncbi:MAG: winged helix-turn-helix transcriptional regulator [Verrucomicrobiales bacterium]|nr:winged helix-turn-helix transcriptional regulator [Verrucomicrobiales bacterium]